MTLGVISKSPSARGGENSVSHTASYSLVLLNRFDQVVAGHGSNAEDGRAGRSESNRLPGIQLKGPFVELHGSHLLSYKELTQITISPVIYSCNSQSCG